MSSNINEVIRAVLHFLIFLRKYFARTKSTKSTESTKSTKRHKDTQAKAQNANKWISYYSPFRCFLGAFFYFCFLVSVLCFLYLWNVWIKKFKIALITSFILLLTIVIYTQFTFLKDLLKALACMTNHT